MKTYTDKKQKKVLGVFNGSLEIYSRYSWVADVKQIKKKEKVLDVFYGNFWVIFLKGAMALLISLKGAICKESLGNPDLNYF